MPNQPTTDYLAQFTSQLNEIDKLEATPGLVRDLAMQTLDNASKTAGLPRSTKQILENGSQALGNITTGSLAANFKVIYAQMCVLAVSSLEALLKTYFANAADAYRQLDADNPKLGQIKITLKEVLASDLRFGGKIGNLILEKDKLSFQDLKSIKEVFKTYFGRELTLTTDQEKQLCFYLECRHVLVHKGGKVDQRFVRSTAVMQANLKGYTESQVIEIDAGDWGDIKTSFSALVAEVTRRRS